jgi:hypothetical protein
LDFKDLKAAAVKGVEDEDVESGEYLLSYLVFAYLENMYNGSLHLCKLT